MMMMSYSFFMQELFLFFCICIHFQKHVIQSACRSTQVYSTAWKAARARGEDPKQYAAMARKMQLGVIIFYALELQLVVLTSKFLVQFVHQFFKAFQVNI